MNPLENSSNQSEDLNESKRYKKSIGDGMENIADNDSTVKCSFQWFPPPYKEKE